MPLKRLTLYISRDLEARIGRIARAENRSQSSVAVEAVRARLERAPGDVPEETARRAVSRVDSRLDKAIGETLLLKEIVLLFVRVWLEHNPPIDDDIAESAAASAEARFERFLDLVARNLSSSGRTVGEISVSPRPVHAATQDEGATEDGVGAGGAA